MPNNTLLEFDEIVEYVTEGPVFHTIKPGDLVADRADDTVTSRELLILYVMEGFIHALKIKSHNLDLAAVEWDSAIPAAVRLRINAWLTKRGWPTVPSGYTWRQLVAAIKARLS